MSLLTPVVRQVADRAIDARVRAIAPKVAASRAEALAKTMIPDAHAALPEPTFQANEAEALFDADGYAAMHEMLGSAKKTARLEFYLFGGPEANKMIDTLVLKKAAGVDVKIVVDSQLGKMFTKQVRTECHEALERMRLLGLDVRLSDTRPLPDLGRKGTLDHTKMITVDGNQALVGGMNVASLYYRYHDVMIKLKGETAADLERQFNYDHQFLVDPSLPRPHGGDKLTPFDAMTPLNPDKALARPVAVGIGRHTIKPALIQNVRAAQKSISIQVCELGDSVLLDELIAAKKRGVDVKVMVDPMHVSSYMPKALRPFVPHQLDGILNAGAVKRLLDAGVQVRTYRSGEDFIVSHLKMSVFDGQHAIVGSTNYTNGGFDYVIESNVELHGGKVIGQLDGRFQQDWASRSDVAQQPALFTRFAYSIYKKISP